MLIPARLDLFATAGLNETARRVRVGERERAEGAPNKQEQKQSPNNMPQPTNRIWRNLHWQTEQDPTKEAYRLFLFSWKRALLIE